MNTTTAAMQNGSTQSGNALFLILIAVALFAALSYAVTQSGRGGGNTKREAISIAVSQALQQAQMFRLGIQRLRVSGTPETALSVVNSGYLSWMNDASHNLNPNCTTTDCLIFDPAGGGVTYALPPAALTAPCATACTLPSTSDPHWQFNGNLYIPGIGDAATPEFTAAFRVDQATCVAINTALGIANPSGAPPQIVSSGAATFALGWQGVFTTSSSGKTLPAELTGKDAGCVNQQHNYWSNDYAWFYVVMIPR